MKLDSIDLRTLNILQDDANITNAALSVKIGISPPAMLERVKKLERNGIIRKYAALVDHSKVGHGTMALVSISLGIQKPDSLKKFIEQVDLLDEVLECYYLAGEVDFILKVVIKDISAYEHFVVNTLNALEGVSRVKTSFVLSVSKYGTGILLKEQPAE